MRILAILFFLVFYTSVSAQQSNRVYTEAESKRILFLLDSTHGELLKLSQALTDSQFFYHVDTDTWSGNDIVEHLGLIDEGYVRELW
ncbi:MAG: hypothetical protein EOO88_53360, partial [Pedobacter sp.]